MPIKVIPLLFPRVGAFHRVTYHKREEYRRKGDNDPEHFREYAHIQKKRPRDYKETSFSECERTDDEIGNKPK